ncbi:MAG: hypothetical protein LIP03_06265 [Bacteroidales bacterium]|nr:hypothetical protein [Bacteroidales bacterium]
MAFENINLDQMAEAVSQDSKGNRNKNMVYNVQTGKWDVIDANQPIPASGLIANEFTREGFA